MPVQQLKKYLDEQEVRYVTVRHSPAFTAQEVAASAHISGYEMAKTVMIKVNGKMAMAVLPAPLHVDLRHLKELTGADKVELAGESEFKAMFPDCELGAMPPFGNLFGLPVYVDSRVAGEEIIAFNAGTHRDVVLMRFKDFQGLVKPEIVHFARPVTA